MRRLLIFVFVLGAGVAGGPARARSLSVVDLLDAYLAGRFDEVVRTLDGDVDFGEVLKQLRKDGPGWISAASPDARARRELTASTFALEAARAGQWHEWKWTIKQPEMCASSGCSQPLNVLSWKAPPLLIEWACERFRQDATPRPIERWWQLAALAVAQRSEDTQFLVGDPHIGKGFAAGEIGNLQDEIKHLDHIVPRFPAEMRFLLAQGIARDREWTDDALSVYGALRNDPDVGGEAMMRLGAMQLRQRRPAEALKQFELAVKLTRDPYVVFLARYLTAKAHESALPKEAEAAYRGAVAAVPHAQSATVALAALLARDGRRAEAQRLVGDMLAANPPPPDPWRGFVHADDRFWPQLIARLRAEIVR